MPNVALTPNYAISTALLKKSIESVGRGEGLKVMHAPVWFQSPCLQSLVDCIYRLVNGIDDATENVIRDSIPTILKTILLACQSSAPASNQSSGQIDSGTFITLYQGDSAASFQVSCKHGGIKLDQLYHPTNTAVFRESEHLEIPLAQLKKECLQFYIQSERDAGRVADLSDLDLAQIDTDGIDFHRTKIQASFVRTLAESGKKFSLKETELVGIIGKVELNSDLFAVDKSSALQMIRAGADRGQVIRSYIDTEQFSENRNIDMTGFDLRGVHLSSVDLQQVDFRQAYHGDHVFGQGEEPPRGPIYDNNIFNALLDPKVRELLHAYAENQTVLDELPAALKSENHPDEYYVEHFADLAERVDQLHQKNIVLRDLNPKTIRLFSGKLFFVNSNSVRQAGRPYDRSDLARNPLLPVEMVEAGITSLSISEDLAGLDIKCDQYSFLITLMELNGFNPDRSSIYFGRQVNDFVDALVTTDSELNVQVKAFLIDPAKADVLESLFDIFMSSRIEIQTSPVASDVVGLSMTSRTDSHLAAKVERATYSVNPFIDEHRDVNSNLLLTLPIPLALYPPTQSPRTETNSMNADQAANKVDSSFGITDTAGWLSRSSAH